jgi:hypothetical protein
VTVVFIWRLTIPSARAMTRFAAWLYTGPVGHLYGGLADWSELMGRYLWAKARGRDPWSG